MKEEKKGIKETQELLAGLTEAIKLGKNVRDLVKGGVSSAGLPGVFNLIKEQSEKLDVYSAAIDNVKEVKEEIKDLDKEEILALVFQIVDAIDQIEKA